MQDYKEEFSYTNKESFPNTRAVNSSGPGNRDGTELKKELVNDVWVYNQALLVEAGMTPNGIEDSLENNQKIQALKKIIKSNEYILPFKVNDMNDILTKSAEDFEQVLLKEKFTEIFEICKNNSKMILKFDNEKCIVSSYSIFEDNQKQQIKLNISGSFENVGVDSGHVEGSVLITIERNANTLDYTNIWKKSTLEHICTQAEYEAITNKSVYVKYIIVSNKNTQTIIDTTINETGRNILTVLNVSDVKAAFTKMKAMTEAKNFGFLRIGDYIEFELGDYGLQKFEIAAFNHYLNRGNPAISKWHITFMSEKVLENAQMNTANENRYYVNMPLATKLNNTVRNSLITAIGQEPLSLPLQWDIRLLTCTAISVYIPQVEEILGTGSGWGNFTAASQGSSGGDWGAPTHNSQFRLFALFPEKIRKKNSADEFKPYWTSSPDRDTTHGFSVVGVDGVSANENWVAFHSYASRTWGVALAFNL